MPRTTPPVGDRRAATSPAQPLAEQPRVRRARAEAVLAHRHSRVEVEQDEVRRRADRDPRPVEAEDRAPGRPTSARAASRAAATPGLDEVRVERRERRLEAGDAERRRLERHVLLLPRVRRVVGRDRGDRAVAQRVDQRARGRRSAAERRVHLHVRVERADRLVGEARGGAASPRRSPDARAPAPPRARSTDSRAERCIRCSGRRSSRGEREVARDHHALAERRPAAEAELGRDRRPRACARRA